MNKTQLAVSRNSTCQGRDENTTLSSDAESAIIKVSQASGVGETRIQRIGGNVFAES